MKKLVTTAAVEIALRALDADSRRRVQSWFDHLRNWDNDDLVRSHSHPLAAFPGVQVLKTGNGIWIFFRRDEDTITVLDLGNKSAILASGHAEDC